MYVLSTIGKLNIAWEVNIGIIMLKYASFLFIVKIIAFNCSIQETILLHWSDVFKTLD